MSSLLPSLSGNLLSYLVEQLRYRVVISWLNNEAASECLLNLSYAMLEVLESLLHDCVGVLLGRDQAVQNRKVERFRVSETNHQYVQHFLRYVSEAEVLDLLSVGSLNSFMKHRLKMLILKLDKLCVVAQASVRVDAPVLEPKHAVSLLLLQQNRGCRLDVQRCQLVALALTHGVAFEDPSIDLAIRPGDSL